MWRMASPLTLTLVLAMICTGGDANWDHETVIAPFSLSNASNVFQSSHNLTCSRDEVIVVSNLYNVYKAHECQCGTDQQCCQFSYEDCNQQMPPEIFQQVTLECWGKSQCRPLVTKPSDSCQKQGKEFPWPAYSVVWYYCVPANTVVDMTRNTPASGYVVTVRAPPASLPHGHSVTCSVQKAEYWQEVLVYVDVAICQGASPLSCLHLQGKTVCKEGWAARDFLAHPPFTFTLQQPANSSMHFAWVTLHELGRHSRIRVSCEPGEATPPSTLRPSGTVALLVAGLVAGVVAALAAISLVFLWRRRWRAKKGKLPNQKGHGVMAELPNPCLTSQTSPYKNGKADSQTLSMSSSA